jgi:hypothetical protein
MSSEKCIRPGDRIPFSLSIRERDLIISRTFVDPEMEARLRRANGSGPQVVVHLTLDDLDDLAGHVAAEANHCHDVRARRVLEGVHDRLVNLEEQHTDEELEPATLAQFPQPAQKFTARQGQYLAFIHYYTKIHGVPPAEADFQQYFKVSPPVVHQTILMLEARGLIDRVPGRPRSIRLRWGRADLPDLE